MQIVGLLWFREILEIHGSCPSVKYQGIVVRIRGVIWKIFTEAYLRLIYEQSKKECQNFDHEPGIIVLTNSPEI